MAESRFKLDLKRLISNLKSKGDKKCSLDNPLPEQMKPQKDNQTHQCNDCGEEFNIKSRLIIHTKRKHIKTKDVPCDLCEKYFLHLADLRTHKISVHCNERPFKCNKCESAFKRSCNLYAHIRETHATDKNFNCPICKQKFKFCVTIMFITREECRLWVMIF